MFHPIRPSDVRATRKSTLVARQLLRAVRCGDIGPGEPLPSERIIADRMCVSRGVVREALSALHISGIVEIRIGEGTFARAEAASEFQRREVLSLLEGNESPLELWESRREIEAVVACLAAPVAVEADIEELEATLDRMRTAMTDLNVEAYLAANSDFHRRMAAPAENSILKRIAFDLIDRTDQLTVKVPTDRYVREDVERSLAKHVDIFTKYRLGEPEALRASIRRHFDDLEVAFLED